MLTKEAFDKIYKELDFEKIEVKNFEYFDKFKVEFKEVLETIGKVKNIFSTKIHEVEKQIKDLEICKTGVNTIKIGDITNDKIINDFLGEGVITIEDINEELREKNIQLNEEKNTENNKSLEILKKYKEHLEECSGSISELNNFWDGYFKKMADKKEKFDKKKTKMNSYREEKYEKYQQECKKITEKAKQNLKAIESMIVFDEKAYKEKIKCFEEKEEELSKKANEFYIELMNRKEIIKKYWSFSFRSILTAAFIGITIPFTAGASIGVAIGSSIASSALAIGAETIDGYIHDLNGYDFKGFTF